MRRALLAVVSGLAVGCTGMNASQADQINSRLTRIEARLDELAVRAADQPSPPGEPETAETRRIAARARVAAEIDELRARGYTERYAPLRQLANELERIDADRR